VIPPIISIVGKSDSGKTTLIEKLLPEIVRRGYKVATVKHHSHDDFQIDVEGKDSWRHAKAGSSRVIISSPTKLALIAKTQEDTSLNDIRNKYCEGIDLILTEGYKKEIYPKIEIFRKEVHRELLCKDDDALVAIVSNVKFDRNVPQFGLDHIKEIVDFIEEKFLKPNRPEVKSSLVENISCFLLAGGQSKRLGYDKALIEIGGERLIDIIIRKLTEVFPVVFLITTPQHNYHDIGAKKIFDIIPNKGSLGGIYTGLVNSRTSHNFFFACDMPFINGDLIRFMVRKKLDYDVLIPLTEKGLQPLHAIYSKACIPHMERLIEEDNFKIIDFFDKVKVEYIPEKICKEFDPEGKIFFNINTPQDLKIAEKINL